jgi:hypothetical protein
MIGRASAVAAVLSAGMSMAGAAEQTGDETLRSLSAERRTGYVTIDGKMSEEAWQSASVADGFWQRDPNEGEPPRFNTEFRVLYDDAALYIGVRAFDPEPDRIRGLLTRRDADSSSDWILVGVDSYLDRRTSFTFALNPASVQRDLLIYDDVMEDASWDAVWEGAAAVDDKGWAAEFRIPYSQLRFATADEQVWGLQVARVVQRTREQTFWTPMPKDKQQRVSLFGRVDGIQDIAPSHRIELLPYTIGGAKISDVDSADPFHDELSPELGVGIDFKYGITSSLTVSGTINPDFGQVEADPSEVNLTANETFFEEKRPFFVEGADIFRFGLGQGDGDSSQEQLFYSRRIGAPPSGEPSGDYSHIDQTTNIIGAGKLSGKTGAGWSVGALTAVTAEEEAQTLTPAGDETTETVEPLTSYTVLRLRKDLNDGRTNIGFAATGVHRALDGTGMEYLHDRAYSGGIQLAHRSAGGGWLVDARVLGSGVHGDRTAIEQTQRAPQRYYQRPDAEHLELDPNRTSLTGMAALASVSKIDGKHWRGAVGFDSRSPGFEVNDLGFQRNADYWITWAWMQYRDDAPGDVVRQYNINHNAWTFSDWAPDLLSYGGNVNAWATLANYWSGGGGVNVNIDRLDTRLLRGGPAVEALPSWGAFANAATDHRKRVRGDVAWNTWQRPGNDTSSHGVSAGVSVQALSNLDVRIAPFVSFRRDQNQYVGEYVDPMDELHYVLATIDQTVAGVTLRANYTVSPTLSVQLYAAPFVAAGEYDDYKQPDRVRAADYDDRFRPLDPMSLVDFEAPDFNFRELRSTLVMRWEYRSGSSLFLIWNHNRDSFQEADGSFRLGSDLRDLSRARGDHALLFKLNYWWGL